MTIASKTRLQIRQMIGLSSGLCIVGTVTTTGDTSSLLDSIGLNQGGDNEYNGRQVQINTTPTGTIVAGEQSFVSSYAAATFDATMSPVFSAAITVGDTYEMWKSESKDYSDVIGRINQMIADAETEVMGQLLIDKEAHTTFTESSRYTYEIPSGFVAIHTVEYNRYTENLIHLDACDTLWAELVDGDVTATIDTTIEKEGSGCLKLVVGAAVDDPDKLATVAITSTDISDCTEIEIWIRSSVALDAGDIRLLLDNTALCASPVETLNIPATTANTWTRHVITLANPENDSAIISVGLDMYVDKGAFTLYVDDIDAVNGNERDFDDLFPAYWDIVRGSTDYIKLTPNALSVAGSNCLLRIKGYQALTAMSADSSTSEVDPDFIKARVLGELLNSDYWRSMAESAKRRLITSFAPGTRSI